MMKSLKKLCCIESASNVDHLDDLLEERRHLRERTRRVAAYRAAPANVMVAASVSADCGHVHPVPLTRHAAHRMQNRAITLDQVLLLTDFGHAQRVHGATRYALDRPARELMRRTLPAERLRSLKSLDIVAVVSDDGALITATHRTRRLRRKVSHH